MKLLCSIFCYLILLLPAYATSTCTSNTPETDCTCAGWGFVEGVECSQCTDTEYSPAGDSTCHACATCDNNTCIWNQNVPHPNNSIFDSENTVDGQSECPWICQSGYYKNGNVCSDCPTNSTSNAGSDDISDCKCANGYYMGGTNNDTCIKCSDTNDLICSGTGLVYSNPAPIGIACGGNTTLVLNDTTHTYSCESCSDSNASLNGNNCVCNQNYYGTPNGIDTQCNKCPAGTITNDIGATNVSQCKMSSNTQFCDSNGNCMNLIPSGANINITQPTNTPTNTPNNPQNYLQ